MEKQDNMVAQEATEKLDAIIADETQEQGVSESAAKRKKRMVVGVIAGVCVLALVGVGVAFAVSHPPVETPAVGNSQEQNVDEQVSKDQEKSEINVLIKADGATDTTTKAKVAVVGKDGLAVISECDAIANKQVKIGELEAGDYELHVTSAPVAEDGSTYKLPESAIKFKVEDKGAEVKLECTLAKIAKEDMTKEQLEATAGVLEGAGKNEAAALARSNAQAAPSVPDSASSVQKTAPAPIPAPAPSGGGSESSAPASPQPEAPSHSHSFATPVYGNGAPIYGQGAPIYGQGAPIYSQQATYGTKCACGAVNPSWSHIEAHIENGEPNNTMTDQIVGYEQVITGYEQVITGYEQVITGYEQIVTGYRCSCGAVQ